MLFHYNFSVFNEVVQNTQTTLEHLKGIIFTLCDIRIIFWQWMVVEKLVLCKGRKDGRKTGILVPEGFGAASCGGGNKKKKLV